ncbi:putative TIM-barrel fold metal-dependent hydrolase [Chitinophaga polysaccharea]|uniref:Putative TIM-barrel fold metal-dependent hydrolase n=1 Tax=Chitinophaga polysaccharea TaxID=1293035 RepID=A0A561P676_9BACT|nr:amidohydrolase family protein [Chitinophaga polysaccharea]TWF33627.1 putative TIM-barrel fold metal-dependent hydrolase [Chitinophaga polysaccharea]
MFDKPIFDAHLHIIDHRFPLQPNQGFLPSEFSVADYQQQVAPLHVSGGAVVSGSFQGFDQQYLLEALKQLGPAYVGVTQIPASTTDEEIIALHEAGVRAVRFNVQRGGSESVKYLEQLGLRVYDLVKWHVELYVDSRQLPGLSTTLRKLPAVVIDHLGLSKSGFKHLLQLVEKGARVKATGFSRCDFDVLTAMRQITAVNPGALLFGTDLPSTRAPRPFDIKDLQLILENFPEDIAAKICRENALALYQPRQQA